MDPKTKRMSNGSIYVFLIFSMKRQDAFCMPPHPTPSQNQMIIKPYINVNQTIRLMQYSKGIRLCRV